MNNAKTLKITLVGIGIALNIIGSFIALTLRLPIYLDSLGTIMVSFLLGPLWGVITGILGSITSGITFDIYSLYFAPVQIFTGLFAGFLYNKGFMRGKKIFIAVLVITIFVSFTGAIITAFVFKGLTSSGSSYILITLNNLGVNPIISAFIVQFFTDYLDKLVACILMISVIKRIPLSLKNKLETNNIFNRKDIFTKKSGY
ncbi:ECF transporter S component [Clostridium tarantellae]|uniref:ECF transporter S component n=1 Tax=Clostridium tarantellae TaxID=39493 RepID=A0A6I1MHK2_9CLOT|nr:ECF transporter S component [Clostridium tarantellae]MPQ42223.1 ECF transporter S component [Clostridium tarantellae]